MITFLRFDDDLIPDSDHVLPLRSSTSSAGVRLYIQNLKVIDNQRVLTQLSRTIEGSSATSTLAETVKH